MLSRVSKKHVTFQKAELSGFCFENRNKRTYKPFMGRGVQSALC
jgi:hypothetical protein